MRRFFVALAAVAAMVGCEKVDTATEVRPDDKFVLEASIVLDETRVVVDGEKFNEVRWVEGDVIRMVSAEGLDMELTAMASGRRNVGFLGEGSAVADVDTYYAVYPSTNIDASTVTFNYAEQSGNDVAALVAKAESADADNLQLQFKPVNALLHVSVSGVESLAKAEFLSFTDSNIAANFTYNFEDDTTSQSGSTASYTVTAPSVDGFFFALPADLEMADGYVVRLTDASGNVCSKAYNGKTFERGTTTRVAIEWSTPVVTLGTPMTSYSYYAEGDSATANSCANNIIYFPTPSTYSNLQKAMVLEAGVIVDGTAYSATLDATNKSFTMGNIAVSSWGAKSVEAYIKTKDGRTFKSAPVTVHITGLPYHADWRTTDYPDWKYINGSDIGASFRINVTSSRVGGYVVGGVITPEFVIPDSSLNVYGSVAASTRATDASESDRCYIYPGTRSSSASMSGDYVKIYYSAEGKTYPDTELARLETPLMLTSSSPCLVFAGETYKIPVFGTSLYTYFYQAKIEYASR